MQILMNENNRSFYPSNMFEFIHHPEYGCCDLKGLIAYYYPIHHVPIPNFIHKISLQASNMNWLVEDKGWIHHRMYLSHCNRSFVSFIKPQHTWDVGYIVSNIFFWSFMFLFRINKGYKNLKNLKKKHSFKFQIQRKICTKIAYAKVTTQHSPRPHGKACSII
jgi:hypothetical protein